MDETQHPAGDDAGHSPGDMPHGTPGEALTIGELARRTGVSPATLRMWETRHGFPRPQRRDSGHRRYDPQTAARVTAVLRRQAAGTRLDAAISETLRVAPDSGSVYAEVRRAHPHVVPRMLRKRTLVALSHAIEDEYAAAAGSGALLCGAFQHEGHLRAALPRWRDLARTSRMTLVLAAGDDSAGETSGPGASPEAAATGDDTTPASTSSVADPLARVPLAAGAPMRREWAVLCESDPFAAVLSAWELPGQEAVPEPKRVFEALWTIEPEVVRTAARVCARVADDAGTDGAAGLVAELAEPPRHTGDLTTAVGLFSRVVAYLDEAAAGLR